ncbi:helix-turn-helix transcriptional regulator [Azospirillum picis]|uniref:AraC-like DNA-binding protein n=1 Tax=Azospirillum picis TaxID=488438 RepID=A0ABU0MG41_9PROT|nr:helix-turn-helix domain-containing protein [Azospirillum picis]MBP2298543.1 AraC-like DNA-binding protein [Azospirillum picis]MDQ0532408.1 AraC-like DNA-binding protein [Azospirillum picis]
MITDLLASLSRFADRDLRPGAEERPHRPELWSFVAHDRECWGEVRIERTTLVTVLEGVKEIADGSGVTRRFPAGTAMLLPPGWTGPVVNEPGGGRYRALVLEFPPGMVRRLLRAHGSDWLAPRPRPSDWRVPLTPVLIDAIHHAAAGLAAEPPLSPTLAEHRCMEVLLALLEDGVWWLGPLTPAGTAEAVRQLIRTHPERRWTACSVAGALNLSTGTLRRRLSEDGVSVRRLLAEERVAHARDLLEREGVSVQEAAMACGYANRSHFARRIRALAGLNPSAMRNG